MQVSACDVTEESKGAHRLQFVLPELFLSCLVEERKIADMVDEHVAEEWQFRVLRRDFTGI